MSQATWQRSSSPCRPPHGGRGLKYVNKHGYDLAMEMSPSPRRAWIEIFCSRSRGIHFEQSPSPRRAWIEISSYTPLRSSVTCRPPHGGRGLKYRLGRLRSAVRRARRPPHGGRGLKSILRGIVLPCQSSPSPRRAWIEMFVLLSTILSAFIVALPTEGVD